MSHKGGRPWTSFATRGPTPDGGRPHGPRRGSSTAETRGTVRRRELTSVMRPAEWKSRHPALLWQHALARTRRCGDPARGTTSWDSYRSNRRALHPQAKTVRWAPRLGRSRALVHTNNYRACCPNCEIVLACAETCIRPISPIGGVRCLDCSGYCDATTGRGACEQEYVVVQREADDDSTRHDWGAPEQAGACGKASGELGTSIQLRAQHMCMRGQA